MRIWSDLLPNLAQLCEGWFFEDWRESFGTEEIAISCFVKTFDLPTGRAAIAEIDQLLKLQDSEGELAGILRQDFKCYVEPNPEHRTWANLLRWMQTALDLELRTAGRHRKFSAGPGTRTLHFPANRPVGALRRYDPYGIGPIEGRGHHTPRLPNIYQWEFFSLAQGEVVVPDDVPMALVITQNGGWDTSPFPVKEPITPSEIQRLMNRTPEEIIAEVDSQVQRAAIDLVFLEEFDPDALYELRLSQTNLVGKELGPIKRLTGLHSLVLHQQKVMDSDLAFLAEHSQLERLTLGFGAQGVSDNGLTFLEGCTALRTLGLNETQVTDRGLGYLRGCTELEELHLDATGIGTQDLAWIVNMQKLWRLNLRHTQVTRAGLSRLAELPSLRWLVISSPHLTENDYAGLRTTLPNCHISQLYWP